MRMFKFILSFTTPFKANTPTLGRWNSVNKHKQKKKTEDLWKYYLDCANYDHSLCTFYKTNSSISTINLRIHQKQNKNLK